MTELNIVLKHHHSNNKRIEIRYTYGGFDSQQANFLKILNGLKNKKTWAGNQNLSKWSSE